MSATIARLSEQIRRLLSGSDLAAATTPSDNEIRIAICQAASAAIKADYTAAALKLGDVVPEGCVIGEYEGVEVQSLGDNRSMATLPVKPKSLRRGVGIFSIYPKYTTTGRYVQKDEFIPLLMGTRNLLDSQPMINDVLGQTCYEAVGMSLYFNKDLKLLYPQITLGMQLVVLDFDQYGDYDLLPIPPEMEMTVIADVLRLYGVQLPSNKKVDSTVKPKGGEA